MDQTLSNEFLAGSNGIAIIRREDDELIIFTSIDEATRSWLNSLHYIWNLCKYKFVKLYF